MLVPTRDFRTSSTPLTQPGRDQDDDINVVDEAFVGLRKEIGVTDTSFMYTGHFHLTSLAMFM